VEDSGPGIPRGVNVEAPFVASDPEGFGMGLAIMKEIVELHEGTVSIEPSRELGGAAIEIRLPDLVSPA
jgi:signal transduction histidine kinase